ncbi:hypothetical protein BSKO_14098 [Bryopsis sp. KO-2023]|nr:hypothetical protein BSKO_14098 [Bryopsis sp. KO-2023]
MIKRIAVVFVALMASCALARAVQECGATAARDFSGAFSVLAHYDDACFSCHNPEECASEIETCYYLDGESFYETPECICCHYDDHGIF